MRSSDRFFVVACGLVLAAGLCLPHAAAQTSGANELYERTLAREQAARAASPVSLDALRDIALAYERLVLKYPASGYADNALWQASGLLSYSYGKTGERADRREAERCLDWLRSQYPTSPFIKQIGSVLTALVTPPATSPTPTTVLASATTAAPRTAPGTAAVPMAPSAPPPPASTPAMLTKVTSMPIPRGERVTLEFDKEVSYTPDRVDQPDRVFVDFANASAPTGAIQQAQHVAGAFVKAMRIGKYSPTVMRVVLDLSATPRYSAFVLYEPFRLVIDVESSAPSGAQLPVSPIAPSQLSAAVTTLAPPPPTPTPTPTPTPKPAPISTGAPSVSFANPPILSAPRTAAPSHAPGEKPAPPASNSSGDYSLARQLGLGVSRIVIDAGHGGHDPGAQSNGINESELVLDVALRLQILLTEQPGFQVVLTRSTDEYLPLEERTAIANREPADLFLSIHANASTRGATRGIETYFLSFAGNPEAEATAARENATSGQSMSRMPDLVKAIALPSKLAESKDFAAIVQTSLVRRLSSQNKNLKDLGVKQAPFVVLIGAQMPSVLAEISFLTNRNDASLLKQSAYRQRIAQALFEAIVKYQGSLKKAGPVATKDTRR